ncbi:hypothetical protein J8273_4818 [Carpediemonas membranifera]|uniref:Uncharacterized protein n=1 Tax=Carpediemonas membranifera TaxID=201153 RepID=A0A8J6DZJ6_9EUKA|nr:hypothetical protein J8273_4818 [Carpediemonas membranifera]|eukprot:KAG9393699.1 hypothetical protein J8273_4818 [Carpediemonas membranifera]
MQRRVGCSRRMTMMLKEEFLEALGELRAAYDSIREYHSEAVYGADDDAIEEPGDRSEDKQANGTSIVSKDILRLAKSTKRARLANKDPSSDLAQRFEEHQRISASSGGLFIPSKEAVLRAANSVTARPPETKSKSSARPDVVGVNASNRRFNARLMSSRSRYLDQISESLGRGSA